MCYAVSTGNSYRRFEGSA